MNSQELETYLQELSLENPVIELEKNTENDDIQQIEVQRKIDWLEETDYQNRAYYREERKAAGSREDGWRHEESSALKLSEHLRQQLQPFSGSSQDRRILEYLLESLDTRGYFTDGIQTAAKVLHVSEEKVKDMLSVIQSLEPAGVGAEDLRECLLLQLRRRPENTQLAEEIVVSCLKELGRNHLQEIARKLHASRGQVEEACRLIRGLEPKPGSVFHTGEPLLYIRPDIFVLKEPGAEETFRIILREGGTSAFRISEYYRDLEKETEDAETRRYLKEKLAQAYSVEKDLEMRKITLYRVAGAIVNRQAEFFSEKCSNRRPLTLAVLADDLELHESTVSRALKGKYLQCSRGVFPLRYFLTGAVAPNTDTGDEQTPEDIKEAIRKIIKAEDVRNPLNDGKIQEKLAQEGIQIARRTVNKYRQEMGIPDRVGRKAW